ncbi:10752_t:CDS:10, partial [Acaulospora colombiana]
MSVVPYDIQVYRSGKWSTCRTDELIPGDVVSVGENPSSTEFYTHKVLTGLFVARPSADQSIPADLLLLQGTVIVNEAMLSGESTPLLKESIELQDSNTKLSIDDGGIHKNSVLFSGTKPLQVTAASAVAQSNGSAEPSRAATPMKSPLPITPDGGALCTVLRTSFGTSQGQLVRTMIFSTDRVSANNLESFLFIGFLLIFAIAASAYVWIMGIERGLKKSKLLLDCVLIVTSVVPPELPMELSLAVNTSLAALSKFANPPQRYSVPSLSVFPTPVGLMSAALTRLERLPLKAWFWKELLDPQNPREMIDVKAVNPQTLHVLATAHALVKLDEDIANSDTKAKKSGDNTVVGDPMEKTTLEALGWQLRSSDVVEPSYGRTHDGRSPISLFIRRRFQFSSALKRMSTVSSIGKGGKCVLSLHLELFLNGMTTPTSGIPAGAAEYLHWLGRTLLNHLQRDDVESNLIFAGFLIFHCPLKPDAIETLKMLADSSHRCVMITGDNPLTAVHVAKEVEIVDRDALILDLRENPAHEGGMSQKIRPINTKLFDEYDICVTGAALRQYEGVHPASYETLVQNTWVYARVSPSQKEVILTTLKSLGYVTLMAGDGTNDVGALKQAHIGVALLDGSIEDLQKIAEHARIERVKGVYETQLKFSQRFNQPPPPVPPMLAAHYPELVTAQERAKADQSIARKKNPLEKFDMASITDKLADMEDDNEPPKIKLGDASCAAPFTSKLSNVSASRCTLVATVQMYKILALNCLITAYSLSVQYLDGIKFGDYQVTITGMLMSPIEQLSRERPLGNIFNFYVLLSVLFQREGPIDLEAKFEPSLLNTAIYLLGLSQQVSTFAINFQGRPFREGITENSALYWGLVGAAGVAFSGATDFIPELNRPLQIVEMASPLFADLAPKPIVTRGRERREARRAAELKERLDKERIEQEKKEAETLQEMERELAMNE